MKTIRHLLLLASLAIAGCATYGHESAAALDALERGDLTASIDRIEKTLGGDSDERLLYHLELGLLRHLNGEYTESNRHLQRAERLADALYTVAFQDFAEVAVTNARQGPYRGRRFERVLIHYYGALNYLLLAAESSGTQAIRHIDDARVEARKLDILLRAFAAEEGEYDPGDEKGDGLLLRVFKVATRLSSNLSDMQRLVYREDAYLRYIIGVAFEAAGEYDNAAIAYRRAAELYDGGFREQFELDEATGRQAWFDAIRAMRAGGDPEWRQLAGNRLSAEERERLDSFFVDRDGREQPRAQLLVIQHLGRVPERRQLDLMLNVDPQHHELYLLPVVHGDAEERTQQLQWFHLIHADTDPLELIYNYNRRGIFGAVESPISKRIPLGPAWEAAEELGLPEAIGPEGTRLTLSWYPPYRPAFGESTVRVDGRAYRPLIDAGSPARCAVQAQLADTGRELRMELARALFKEAAANRLAGETPNPFARFAAKLFTTASAAAETRSWLTLPAAIRIQRIAVDSGYHDVELATRWNDGRPASTRSLQVDVPEGTIRVIRIRTTGRLAGADT